MPSDHGWPRSRLSRRSYELVQDGHSWFDRESIPLGLRGWSDCPNDFGLQGQVVRFRSPDEACEELVLQFVPKIVPDKGGFGESAGKFSTGRAEVFVRNLDIISDSLSPNKGIETF